MIEILFCVFSESNGALIFVVKHATITNLYQVIPVGNLNGFIEKGKCIQLS